MSRSHPESLAGAIRTLVDNPARAQAMGAAARKEIFSRYSFERMVHSFQDLYDGSLGRTPMITGTTEPALTERPRVEGPALSERQRVEGAI